MSGATGDGAPTDVGSTDGGLTDGVADAATIAARARPKKAPNAFRTISEVADDLHIPQHVLRFWETKFPQVKPLKRGGGRRYYRPDDIALLRRISDLLYIQGYTIKGVQRLLRDGGGRLSDDIPPPSPDEQAAAAAERDAPPSLEPELPMPGLLPPSSSAPQTTRVTPRPKFDPEAERLRTLLVETLRELEELRALIG
jgi:DNA-binding transcriptional MerR regulator